MIDENILNFFITTCYRYQGGNKRVNIVKNLARIARNKITREVFSVRLVLGGSGLFRGPVFSTTRLKSRSNVRRKKMARGTRVRKKKRSNF